MMKLGNAGTFILFFIKQFGEKLFDSLIKNTRQDSRRIVTIVCVESISTKDTVYLFHI